MRETLNFQVANRKECRTWEDALRLFVRQADSAGVLVMISGVVMSNNHRRLDPSEFRGFALSDPLAPLVFVNGADTKAAQMFTLAHEPAHLWLGASALSDVGVRPEQGARSEEVWCNAVAAEFLVPLDALRCELHSDELLPEAMSRLARTFKVSTLVVLRRLLDAGWIEREMFEAQWSRENARLRTLVQRNSGGGDFHRTTIARVSRRFARALVVSTSEGQTLYRDALRMLGISKIETFNSLVGKLNCLTDHVPARRERFHSGQEPALRFRFRPGVLGLARQGESGRNSSEHRKVADELRAGDDELPKWADDLGDEFFLTPDSSVIPALSRVSDWAGVQNYDSAAVATFLQVADYWLVAHALAHHYVVVTHEVPADTLKKIKIPNACTGLRLRCISPYQMLRQEKARFVLS